jgi:hypothetical protein
MFLPSQYSNKIKNLMELAVNIRNTTWNNVNIIMNYLVIVHAISECPINIRNYTGPTSWSTYFGPMLEKIIVYLIVAKINRICVAY